MKAILGLMFVAALAVEGSQLQEQAGRLRVKRHFAGQPASNADTGNSLLKFISDIGPQLESARLISNLFSGANSPAGAPEGQAAGSGPSFAQVSQFASQLQSAISGSTTPAPAMQLFSSLTDILRNTQENGAKAAASAGESIQTGAQLAQQNVANAGQQAQTGFQSALVEIGQGLRRITNNNPSLIPDVKNLYNSVSSKLSTPPQAPALPQALPASAPIVV